MVEQRRLAVILARHDTSQVPPALEDCRRVVLSGNNSIYRYWRENAEGWFEFPLLDFFGPHDIMLPPAPGSRYTVLDRAKAAAAAAGADLSGYDGFIVMNFPGTGYDAGSTGIGPGNSAVLGVSDNMTFYCHEIGHVLGFDHSYGIPNAGSDWSDDGITQLNEVYGDPYDLMSSAAFGDASPTFEFPAADAIAGFAGARSAGPMLARAQLHFHKPGALEATGKVQHVYETGNDEVVTLHPAGRGVPGETELLVYHPANEDAEARGRIYVEYRQPFDFNWASRWDAGLAPNGAERDRTGIIVHVVKDIPGLSQTAVWYAARVVFPTPDADVRIDTPRGAATVTVSTKFLGETTPGYVRVRVNRQNTPRISVAESSSDNVTVVSSERRPIPGWEWAGEFTWERRQTIRTATYTPIVAGLGGAGPIAATSGVKVQWYIGNSMLVPDSGTAVAVPDSAPHAVSLAYSIDPETRVLTLSNTPGDGSYTLRVQASASDEPTWANPITADTTFSAEGSTEGWGQDYRDFMDMWERITNPAPRRHFGPPRPDDYRAQIERIQQVFDRLQTSNPAVAERLHPMVLDQQRVLRRYVLHR